MRKVSVLCLLLVLGMGLVSGVPFSFESLSISPELDFAYFGAYVVSANISGAGSVVMNVSGINGEGVYCWDYYVDGSCASENNIISMNHDGSLWNGFIYPDYIYPEVHFVGRDVTWYNESVSVGIHRNNFHLFNFSNPFSMVSNTTLWLEFNAVPTNDNSHRLEVYLVSKDAGADYFSGDWRSGEYTSLVSYLDRNTELHHTHSEFSSHHVVGISTDEFGLVNGFNLSDSFWLVLYNHMNQASRGWDLRYHDINNCDSFNAWFTSSGAGLNFHGGCPDVHFHISRRNEAIMDGANVSLNIDGEVNIVSEIFYFGEMSPVYPNPTSFITPQDEGFVNGVVNVSWLPSSVPNDDDIEYSVFLSNETGYIETFITTEDVFSFDWDTSVYDDGDYELMLYYCADPRGSNLCSNSTITVGVKNVIEWVVPSNVSLVYGESWGGAYFVSSENLNFSVNSSDFVIDNTGFLNVSDFLYVGDYFVEVVAEDFLNNSVSAVFFVGVVPAPLNVTVYNMNKTRGDLDDFSGAVLMYSGFVLGEDAGVLSGSAVVSRSSGEYVGVYELSVSNLSSLNYDLFFEPSSFSIFPAPLNISVFSYEKFVGDSDPFFDYNISGFVLGENLSHLSGHLVVSREPGEAVGAYEIFAYNVTSVNYDIAFFDGVLTILEESSTPSTGGGGGGFVEEPRQAEVLEDGEVVESSFFEEVKIFLSSLFVKQGELLFFIVILFLFLFLVTRKKDDKMHI